MPKQKSDSSFDVLIDTINYYVPESTAIAIRTIGANNAEKKDRVEVRRMVLQEMMKVARVQREAEWGTVRRDQRMHSSRPPRLVGWKKTQHGTLKGRIYGSRQNTDGEWIETQVVARGKVRNGSMVRTRDGERYLLSKRLNDASMSKK